jgi:hypothetical protein
MDHQFIRWYLGFDPVPTRPTIAPTLVFEGPSVHPTVSSLFLFLLGFDPLFWHFCKWFSCILGPRNVYKDMLKQ